MYSRGEQHRESKGELYGEYFYTIKDEWFEKNMKSQEKNQVYYRYHKDDKEMNLEEVFNIEQIPHISKSVQEKAAVDKLKMSDDHSMIAITVDLYGSEDLTGFIRDMKKQEYIADLNLD